MYENLKKYSTERQYEILKTLSDTSGNVAEAAKLLQISKSLIYRTKQIVERKATVQGDNTDFNMNHPAPDGFKCNGTTTLYKGDEPILQWVKTTPDRERQEQFLRETLAVLTEDLPNYPPVDEPTNNASDLLTVYPIADVHLGMLAWDEESGDDYNLSLGETLLVNALNYLTDISPKSESALIVLLGDFIHYDGFDAVTPQHRHQLSSDSRFTKIIRTAIRATRTQITKALTVHKRVTVIIELGNHDPAFSTILTECLANVYEKEPRVYIDTTPQHYHYYKHGKCLIGTHHGDKVKMCNLPLIMATDKPVEWGESSFKYWYTGHLHQDITREYRGVKCETFRTLAPADNWASAAGYKSGRDAKAIVLHKDFGEISRLTIPIDLLNKQSSN